MYTASVLLLPSSSSLHTDHSYVDMCNNKHLKNNFFFSIQVSYLLTTLLDSMNEPLHSLAFCFSLILYPFSSLSVAIVFYFFPLNVYYFLYSRCMALQSTTPTTNATTIKVHKATKANVFKGNMRWNRKKWKIWILYAYDVKYK